MALVKTQDRFSSCAAFCGYHMSLSGVKSERETIGYACSYQKRPKHTAAKTMICTKCASENQPQNKFCGNCAAPLAPAPLLPDAGTDSRPCARHPKMQTRLRCGRCELPICPRCTVYTPAGTRCRACAQNKVAVRPQALLHEAGRLASRGGQALGKRAWYLTLWYLILSLFRGWGE